MVRRACRAAAAGVVAFALALGLALAPSPASGFGTDAKSLDELTKRADLVVKAKVLSETVVNDAWFGTPSGFEVREAQLAVISVLKGSPPTRTIRFRHFARAQGGVVRSMPPLHFALTAQRAYLFFASCTGGADCRQVTKEPSRKSGESAMLAGDDRPHRGRTVTEAAWAELATLLKSPAPDDAASAVEELNDRSGGRSFKLADFPRRRVLDLFRSALTTTTGPVQLAIISVFGARSPYTDPTDAPHFFASTHESEFEGFYARQIENNTEGDVAVAELTAIGDSRAPAEARGRAIRALGRTSRPHAAAIARWLADPEPLVRSAAVMLAADGPDRKAIALAAGDSSDVVRASAALAMGFVQDVTLLPRLGALLHDASSDVRQAAAMSVLSYSTDDAGAVMKANLGGDYRSLFAIALARKDASPYLSELAEVTEKDLQPAAWWGGVEPSGVAWDILFRWVAKQPAATLSSKKLGPFLDTLEHGHGQQPLSLYALYVARGLPGRARILRDEIKRIPTWRTDLDLADRDPASYLP